ncbi:guanine deaminase, partial [Psychromonas arctica]
SLDHKGGNFEKGKEADFIVLYWAAKELQTLRLENSNSLQDNLFALMMLGDDRNIHSTYVAGKLDYSVAD